jgi:hypothetical protein
MRKLRREKEKKRRDKREGQSLPMPASGVRSAVKLLIVGKYISGYPPI